jgi:hypothetical protein
VSQSDRALVVGLWNEPAFVVEVSFFTGTPTLRFFNPQLPPIEHPVSLKVLEHRLFEAQLDHAVRIAGYSLSKHPLRYNNAFYQVYHEVVDVFVPDPDTWYIELDFLSLQDRPSFNFVIKIKLKTLGRSLEDLVLKFALAVYETTNERERIALPSDLVLHQTLSATLAATLQKLLPEAKHQIESQKVYFQLLAN